MNNSIQFEDQKKTNSRFGTASFIVSLSAVMLIILSFLHIYQWTMKILLGGE